MTEDKFSQSKQYGKNEFHNQRKNISPKPNGEDNGVQELLSELEEALKGMESMLIPPDVKMVELIGHNLLHELVHKYIETRKNLPSKNFPLTLSLEDEINISGSVVDIDGVKELETSSEPKLKAKLSLEFIPNEAFIEMMESMEEEE